MLSYSPLIFVLLQPLYFSLKFLPIPFLLTSEVGVADERVALFLPFTHILCNLSSLNASIPTKHPPSVPFLLSFGYPSFIIARVLFSLRSRAAKNPEETQKTLKYISKATPPKKSIINCSLEITTKRTRTRGTKNENIVEAISLAHLHHRNKWIKKIAKTEQHLPLTAI